MSPLAALVGALLGGLSCLAVPWVVRSLPEPPQAGDADEDADPKPAYVDLGDARPPGVQDQPHPATLRDRTGTVDHPVGDVDQIDLGELQPGRAGVEPADLEQVAEQVLEPVQLGLQQLGSARGDRIEGVA